MSATFQSSVFRQQGFGVPGEIFQDVPWTVLSWTLNSSGTPNVVGSTAYTITGQGYVQAGSGGSYGFAGILCSPKDYALFGTSEGPLEPTLILPDQTQAALLTQGMMIVTLPAAANIGDYVIYDNTTGALATQAPSDTITVGYSFANAVVSQFPQSISGSGLAVINVNPIVYPYPA
jgi:hypothetical protein